MLSKNWFDLRTVHHFHTKPTRPLHFLNRFLLEGICTYINKPLPVLNPETSRFRLSVIFQRLPAWDLLLFIYFLVRRAAENRHPCFFIIPRYWFDYHRKQKECLELNSVIFCFFLFSPPRIGICVYCCFFLLSAKKIVEFVLEHRILVWLSPETKKSWILDHLKRKPDSPMT
jgi:hypothetical protein